jgi:NADH-quinone oxidoreductase subunit M
VARILPHFAWAFLLVTMASIGLPGTSGFVAEFLVMLGLARVSMLQAALAAGGVILGAVYMLTMFRRVMHGPVTTDAVRGLTPVTLREGLALAVYVTGILALGVRPAPWLAAIRPDVVTLLGLVGRTGAG